MATTIPYAEFLGDRDPYPVLETTPGRIAELCHGLSDAQIMARPEPGKWSIHLIVAHLADCELMFQVRVRLILFENEPFLASFDQDTWSNGWERENEPFAETMERFRVLRISTLRLFRSTPDEDLKRTGTHPERGVQQAGDFRFLAAGHDINHLGQIESARARLLATR